MSVRPFTDNDCGHDFVEVLLESEYRDCGFEVFKIAAYRVIAKCEGTPAETIDKLEKAVETAKKSKKIDWAEIDALIVSLRMTSESAVAVSNAEAAWSSSSLHC